MAGYQQLAVNRGFSDDCFTEIRLDYSCLKCLWDTRRLEASSLGMVNLFQLYVRLIHCQVGICNILHTINVRHYSTDYEWAFRLVSGVLSQSLKCDSSDFNEIRAPPGDIIVAIHVKRNVFRHSPGNQSREISFRLILRVGKGSDPKYITPKYIYKINFEILQEKSWRMMDWLEKQNAGVQITILTIPLIAVILFGAIMERI